MPSKPIAAAAAFSGIVLLAIAAANLIHDARLVWLAQVIVAPWISVGAAHYALGELRFFETMEITGWRFVVLFQRYGAATWSWGVYWNEASGVKLHAVRLYRNLGPFYFYWRIGLGRFGAINFVRQPT